MRKTTLLGYFLWGCITFGWGELVKQYRGTGCTSTIGIYESGHFIGATCGNSARLTILIYGMTVLFGFVFLLRASARR